MPEFVCQEYLQLDIQRSFFSKRALYMHLVKAHGHRPSIGQYIGPDNRCPVCHVTFALRYLAVALAPFSKSFVPPRHLSGSIEKVSQVTDKPLIVEARRLRTAAREKWGSLMFRLRGLHSVPENLHPMMVIARHNRQSVSVGHQSYVFSSVAIARPCHVCPDVGSPAHKRPSYASTVVFCLV